MHPSLSAAPAVAGASPLRSAPPMPRMPCPRRGQGGQAHALGMIRRTQTHASQPAKGFARSPPPPTPTTTAALTPLEIWAAAAGVVFPKVRVADFGGTAKIDRERERESKRERERYAAWVPALTPSRPRPPSPPSPIPFPALRGLAATAPIADGETIVTLPVSAALLVRPKSRCPLPAAWCGAEHWRSSPWFVKMGLLILEAAARPPRAAGGDATPVDGAAAYVAGLPAVDDGLDTPALGWSEAEVEALACPPLAADVSLVVMGEGGGDGRNAHGVRTHTDDGSGGACTHAQKKHGGLTTRALTKPRSTLSLSLIIHQDCRPAQGVGGRL
jgi:hypothetical protein